MFYIFLGKFLYVNLKLKLNWVKIGLICLNVLKCYIFNLSLVFNYYNFIIFLRMDRELVISIRKYIFVKVKLKENGVFYYLFIEI